MAELLVMQGSCISRLTFIFGERKNSDVKDDLEILAGAPS